MTAASPGDTVRIHYTGRLTDGTEFDSSTGGEPLEFQVGANQIIRGLDEAVEGMQVGDTSTVTIPADKAYGPHHAEAVSAVPRDTIPPEIALEPGLRLQAQRPDGTALGLTVVEVGEDQVTLDANHPLAGQDLVFDLELVAVV
jgi:peptidylprolyl isomerase